MKTTNQVNPSNNDRLGNVLKVAKLFCKIGLRIIEALEECKDQYSKFKGK